MVTAASQQLLTPQREKITSSEKVHTGSISTSVKILR